MRADKTKSGKKAPRKFDIIPLHKELNNEQESEDIQLSFASKNSTTSRSTYDDIIDSVVNQAYVDMDLSIVETLEVIEEHEDEIQPKDAVASKRRISFLDDAEEDVPVSKRLKVRDDSGDELRLVLDDTIEQSSLKITFVADGKAKIKNIPKSKLKQVKPIYINYYNFSLIPNKV